MSIYQIEINGALNEMLSESARKRHMPIEQLIEEMLNKYFIPKHTLKEKEMEEGYKAVADINLDWANL